MRRKQCLPESRTASRLCPEGFGNSIGIRTFPAKYRTATNFLQADEACAAHPMELGFEVHFLVDRMQISWSETGVSAGQPGHISLDLTLEPCNNYPRPYRARLGVFASWQKYEFKRVSPSRMPCAGSSAKCSRKTSSRRLSVTPCYLKPGEKKRVKEALARKRSRKKARKEQD